VNLADPGSVSAAIGVLDTVLGDPLLRSFEVLAPLLSIAGERVQFPVQVAGAPACAGAPGVAPAIFPTASVAGGWPDTSARRVFVYDSATHRYRATSDSSGPANGVRFLLYQTDAVQPLFPLTATGWMDLAVSGLDSLRGLIADQAATFMDYRAALQGSQQSYAQTLTGTVVGGGHVLAFRDSTARLGGELKVTATVDDSAADVHLALIADRTVLDQFDDFYGLDFRFRQGADSVRLTGRNDTYCLLTSIDLTMTVNGGSFARVTNGASASNPTITRADGQALSPAQRTAVLDLIRVQRRLFDWLSALSSPGALTLAP
jgi:hypothetical protein